MLYALMFSLIATVSQAKTLRVAVIDTGYLGPVTHLCPTGHYDFVKGLRQVGADSWGHGAKVTKAIEAYAKDTDYCILVYKVFDANRQVNNGIIRAVYYALSEGADVINLSVEGPTYEEREKDAIKAATMRHTQVFIAAGNEGHDLNVKCNAFPACYGLKGVHVIGSIIPGGNPIKVNTGDIIEENEDLCFEGACGTSLSSAIATGKYIYKTLKKENN